MKLNIGCGPFYKKGYVNIDAFDTTVSDKRALSWQLPFKDSSVEEVSSFQLLEHLGYLPTIFSLWEWYRVLKDRGKLVIETVDLEKTLEAVQKGKAVKIWLFGKERDGMVHKYCFGEGELKEILESAGFAKVKFTKKIGLGKPVLRITTSKKRTQRNDFVAGVRKRLLSKEIVDPSKIETLSYERESYLEWFEAELKENDIKKSDTDKFQKLLIEGMIIDPELAVQIIEALPAKLKRKFTRHKKLSKKLTENRFSAFLAYLLYRIPKAARFDSAIMSRVKQAGRDYINLHLEERLDIAPGVNSFAHLIYKKGTLPSFLKNVQHFSLVTLKELSLESECKAVAAWSKGNEASAKRLFARATQLYASAFFSYWNLARINHNQKLKPQAIIDYEKAWETVPDALRIDLEKEINDVTRKRKHKKYLEPKENVYY